MVKNNLRGHKIEFLNNQWVYFDTKEPTIETYKSRNCGHCNLPQTEEGHDGCLGTLRGVSNACCGHGEAKEAYIQFIDGSDVIRGKEAINTVNSLRQ